MKRDKIPTNRAGEMGCNVGWVRFLALKYGVDKFLCET